MGSPYACWFNADLPDACWISSAWTRVLEQQLWKPCHHWWHQAAADPAPPQYRAHSILKPKGMCSWTSLKIGLIVLPYVTIRRESLTSPRRQIWVNETVAARVNKTGGLSVQDTKLLAILEFLVSFCCIFFISSWNCQPRIPSPISGERWSLENWTCPKFDSPNHILLVWLNMITHMITVVCVSFAHPYMLC